MNPRFVFSAVFAGILGLSTSSFSAGGGRDALTFLNLGMGARPMGMAGAFTAVADDVNAIFYNPAGLANLESFQASLLHQRWIVDLSYSYLGAALPINGIGTFAGSLLHLGTPQIEAFDEFNQRVGNFTANDLAFSVSYGRSIVPGLAAGLTTKFVREVLDQSSANAFSLDLGVLYTLGADTKVGAFLGNMGTSVKHFADSPLESSKQAGILRFGISTRKINPKVLSSLELTKQFDDDAEIKIGGEYKVTEAFRARMGYAHEFGGRQTGGISGISAGVGFRYGSLIFDYALSSWGDLGLTHMLGFTFVGKGTTAEEPLAMEEPSVQTPDEQNKVEHPAVVEDKAVEKPGPAPRIEESPKTLEAAVELLKAGKAVESIKILTVLSKKQPRDPRIYLYTGLALKSLGKTDRARGFFEAAIKLAPKGTKIRKFAEKYLKDL